MKYVDTDTRLRLFGWFDAGQSVIDKTKETGLPKTTVYRWKKRYDEGESTCDRQRSGRPKKTTDKQDHRLFHLAQRHRKITSAQLNSLWSRKCDVDVSSRTVRYRWNKQGLRGCIAKKKPLITKTNKVKRYDWAIQMKDWMEDNWNSVLWSDESSFQLFQNSRRTVVWRRKGEEYEQSCISKTVKTWRWITNGVGLYVR